MNQPEEAVMKEPSKTKLPSPQERLDLVLLGLIREQTVGKLCEQAGVSKALFYQWLRRGREGLLKALEAKKPGRKPAQEKQSPQEVLALQERLKRMEQEIAGLRKERDRFKLITEVAQRVIHRNGWNPEPQKRRAKKNDLQMTKREIATLENGLLNEAMAPPPARLRAFGESAAAPTGDGSAESLLDGGQGLGSRSRSGRR